MWLIQFLMVFLTLCVVRLALLQCKAKSTFKEFAFRLLTYQPSKYPSGCDQNLRI